MYKLFLIYCQTLNELFFSDSFCWLNRLGKNFKQAIAFKEMLRQNIFGLCRGPTYPRRDEKRSGFK